ncbi:MAG: helix-turn-helix domain-containing protein [Alistipes senegalensis]|nr:helix-turn-helix domain-containing protein [Alistipes senegalensis]MCI7307748.1 helix-turn-helix domain-containing protein [Alistipes senegalensis]
MYEKSPAGHCQAGVFLYWNQGGRIILAQGGRIALVLGGSLHWIFHVDALCVPLRRKRDKWLDNCETCRLLNVSARTMQTYRDTGKLPYSQINNKIYYKASDVETFLLSQVRDNSKK